MPSKKLCSLALAFTLFVPSLRQSASAQSAPGTHWVATWASSQQIPRSSIVRPPTPPPPADSAANTATAPATPPAPPATRPARSFNDQTVRMVMRASIGGSTLRVHLSNAFGTTPLVVGSAHIALRDKDSAIVPTSDRALTFNGKPSIIIPIGAEMISDPVALTLPPLAELTISVYVPGDTGPASTHALGLHTTWVKTGDVTAAPDLADGEKLQSWYWVSGVDVQAPAESAAIVALGDSITDGATSTPDTDSSWPSVLSQRLAANPATAKIAVVNQGISGNRILSDGAGVSALARFDRDVIAQPGVKWLLILEGINDMNAAGRPPAPGAPVANTPPVTADDLIGAMKQMVLRAHDHGIKVIGCTLTPFGNATDKTEAMRQALNAFIRTPGAFDSVVDFDKVIQDPADPRQFRAGYNKSDKLHPNDAGYKAMADAIDLSLFNANPPAAPTRKK